MVKQSKILLRYIHIEFVRIKLEEGTGNIWTVCEQVKE